ncbi:FecR domain-containing protein [Chitinophaga sp. GCM10012297]|uniref:FecR domain-containing protein n=1 Tax=Chitinophaga chungangae TaxID=2821488 RepID=A0ABS3YIQ8_9BACT|nr:FecR domain-containing protein [Chitinophaga chungangae]MBO9154574.1 FecR domain-containing protein [Chitinophaga chungangae]
MTQPEQYLEALLAKKEWTDEECRWLLHYLEHTPAAELKAMLLEAFLERNIPVPDAAVQENILARIHAQMQPFQETKVVPMRRSRKWLVAAAIAGGVVIAGGVLRFSLQQRGNNTQPSLAVALQHGDIAPGGNKARLVLGNGKSVVLDQAADGAIASEENIRKQNESLIYKEPEAQLPQMSYNTLITPRGGQYRVQLSDGTKVWLNAASSLEYPVAFNGSEREVKLSGEAYFEVAADAFKPFYVTMNGMKVQVLGTAFNIKAYADEKEFTTTLTSGAVRVISSGKQVTLKPGQQSTFTPSSLALSMSDGDPEGAVAWKNGIINFRNDELSAVMRELSRWYDVDVVYDNTMTGNIHVTGAMHKQENLSQALKILELTANVHFTVERRTIKVSQ